MDAPTPDAQDETAPEPAGGKDSSCRRPLAVARNDSAPEPPALDVDPLMLGDEINSSAAKRENSKPQGKADSPRDPQVVQDSNSRDAQDPQDGPQDPQDVQDPQDDPQNPQDVQDGEEIKLSTVTAESPEDLTEQCLSAPLPSIDQILMQHPATPYFVRETIRRIFVSERYQCLCQACASYQNFWTDPTGSAIIRAFCPDCCGKLSRASKCQGGYEQCIGYLPVNELGVATALYCFGCFEAEKASYRSALSTLPVPPSVRDVFEDDLRYGLLCYPCATLKHVLVDPSPPLLKNRKIIAAFCVNCLTAMMHSGQDRCQKGYDGCTTLVQYDALGSPSALCANCEARDGIRTVLSSDTGTIGPSRTIPSSVRDIFRDDEQYALLCGFCAALENFRLDPEEGKTLTAAFCESCRSKLSNLGKKRCPGESKECIGKLWHDELGAPAALCTKCYAQSRQSSKGRNHRRTHHSYRKNRQRKRR